MIRSSRSYCNCFMAGNSKCDGLQAGVKMTVLMRNTVLNKNSYSSTRNVVYFFGRNTIKRIIVKINWFITLVKGFLKTNNCRIKIWWKHNELFTTGLQPTYVPLHHRRHTGNRWRGWEVMSLREDYSVSKTPYLLNIRTGLLVNWGGDWVWFLLLQVFWCLLKVSVPGFFFFPFL